jgi:hypothetical protein
MMTDESVLLTASSPCSEISALKSQYGFIALLPTPSNNSAHGEENHCHPHHSGQDEPAPM